MAAGVCNPGGLRELADLAIVDAMSLIELNARVCVPLPNTHSGCPWRSWFLKIPSDIWMTHYVTSDEPGPAGDQGCWHATLPYVMVEKLSR